MTVVIHVAQLGREWVATSPDLPGFRVFADDEETVREAAREKAAPAGVEFRAVP